MNYFLAPRSGEKSYKNFKSTIKHGIPMERIADFLTPEEREILSSEPIIYAWGNRKGTRKAWEAMRTGDVVIFYAKGRFVMAGEVYFKKNSPGLALAMWPPDENGNPWSYTFFLRNLKYISIPVRVFNDAVGYKPNNVIQRFTHLGSDKISRIIHQYGSIEKLFGLFEDSHSPEVPKSGERLYVNIPEGAEPTIVTGATLSPSKIAPDKPSKKSGRKKVNWAARNRQNAIIGSLGEEYVVKIEYKRLTEAGRKDLAEKIVRVSTDDDSLGYDILSYEVDGTERLIEVKSTIRGGDPIRFFVSANEYLLGKKNGNFFIYYVENADTLNPTVTIIDRPVDESRFTIRPDGYIFEAERDKIT